MMIKISSLLRVTMAALLLGASLLGAPMSALASNALLDFSENLKSFSANFTQTVYDADSVVLQESTGVVVLARPGRFKWTYDAPVNQVIVADGLTLWVYDEEIKQVTKQPQSTTLGSAPIGLLSGQRDIENEFVIEELGKKDDLEWFQLQPLVSDTDFNEIFIALDGDGLHAMELRDNFDQATQIVFSQFEKNIALDSDQFTFVVPEGVDVVGEGGVPESQDDLLRDDSPVDESGVSTSQSSDTDAPADLPAGEPTLESDPLLEEDTDPLLDDISISGSENPESQDPALQENVTLVPASVAPGAPGVEESAPVESAPLESSAIKQNPVPNSDEDLLGGDELRSTDPALQTETSAGSSMEPATPPAADEAPQADTANPSREITFEERKVTN